MATVISIGPGPVDVYVEGTLLARANIGHVDKGGVVHVGLGVEDRVRIARNVRMEEEAAGYARTMAKPVTAFIAGAASPAGKRMGHAGTIVSGDKGTYNAKKRALEKAGVTVTATPNEVAGILKGRLSAL